MNNKIYAGIGSRETPEDVQHWMYNIAVALSDGWTLRSGHAGGADMAFEEGANKGKGKQEIYIPWVGFNNANVRDSKYILPSFLYPGSRDIAAKHHPAWSRCTEAARNLHTRNVAQILGIDLETKANMVICWTKDGKASGGTGQAMRIAKAYSVPIFNLYIPDDREKLMEFIK